MVFSMRGKLIGMIYGKANSHADMWFIQGFAAYNHRG
jgi:hypothetical protein